jgi:PAS domain S-box-containing protein
MKPFVWLTILMLVACPATAEQHLTPLKLGVLAYRPKPQVTAQWQPVADYIQSSLSRPVELAVYNHSELADVVARRAVDLVITTANQFILLQHTAGLSAPVATLMMREGPYHLSAYGSAIITRADRGDIGSLRDLAGQRVAVVSLQAFGGYQMPAFELLEASIPLPKGEQLLVTGQPHDRVIEAVLDGRADAGFVRAGLLESLAEKGVLDFNQFKVINRQNLPRFPYAVSTRLYPEWPVATMPQIDRETGSRLAAILYLMPPEILEGSKLYGFGVPANYDGVESLLRGLRMPPFDHPPEISLVDLWHHYSWWIIILSALLLLLALASTGLVALVGRSRRSLRELERLTEKEKMILASLAEGVYGVDPDGRCIFINPRALSILGFAEGDVVGKNTHTLFHRHADDGRLNSVETCPVSLVLRDGKKRELEDQFIHRDGSKIPVWLGVSVLLHEGVIVGAVVVFQDITERKQAEEALRESEQQMVRFLANVEGFLFTFRGTPDGHFSFPYASPGIEKYYGLKPEDVREDMTPLHQMAHPEDRPFIEAAIAESARRMTPFRAEFRVCRSDAPERWIEARSIPQPARDGNVLWYGIMLDITERKQAEEALRQSEMKYRQIVSTAREGIWVLGPDTKTTFVNARMAEILGYSVDELVGRPMDDFMFEEDVPDHRRKMEARRQGVSESYERRFRRKDKQTVWTLSSATPIYEEGHRFNGSFAMLTDITERKRNDAVNSARLHLVQFSMNHSLHDLLKETLNQAEELTGSLIGFYQFVEEDQISLTMQNCSTRTKVAFSKAEGKGLHYPRDEAGAWVDCLRQRKAVMHNDNASLPHPKEIPEGHDQIFRELVVPVFRGENITAILGVGNKPAEYNQQDVEIVSLIADLAWEIAERKRIEEELDSYHHNLEELVATRTQELAKARDAAEAANRAKSVFLSNMSHELRTPLNAILGFTEIMVQDKRFPEDEQGYLEVINRSGHHLLSLINDVLEISRIEAGRLELQSSAFDLQDMLRTLHDFVELGAKEKGLVLHMNLPASLPRYIVSDAGKLRQVLLNLLSNAVKFTEQGEIELSVTSETAAQHTLLSFTVRDTGRGIAAADVEQIFRPFFQAEKGAALNAGTGLGLTISREYAQLLGGSLSAESELNKGSTFHFNVPVELSDASEQTEPDHGPVVGLQAQEPEYRVLLVEDDPDNRQLLEEILKRVDFHVRAASNGEQAIEVFRVWHPDFIWMDMRMPVMDGYEATRRIRALPGGHEVKIVALTASAFREDRGKIIDAGCDDVLPKPLDQEQLFITMEHLLGVRYRYADLPEYSASTMGGKVDLSSLPPSLREALCQAAVTLDQEGVQLVVNQIREIDLPLSGELERLIHNYRYDKILAYCDKSSM